MLFQYLYIFVFPIIVCIGSICFFGVEASGPSWRRRKTFANSMRIQNWVRHLRCHTYLASKNRERGRRRKLKQRQLALVMPSSGRPRKDPVVYEIDGKDTTDRREWREEAILGSFQILCPHQRGGGGSGKSGSSKGGCRFYTANQFQM